ncbi:MAG: very short patch repair endonuclease, partial [Pseudomonadota bacterium]
MADVFSPQQRARVMAAVKGRDTGPELRLRRALHGLGLR